MKTIYSILPLIIIWLLSSCYAPHLTVKNKSNENITGDDFYKSVLSMSTSEREHKAIEAIFNGNIPSFLKKFSTIKTDTIIEKKRYRMKLFVSPDYISIGNNGHFARIPLTPSSAQIIADSFHCFLPTKKIVDLIYQQAKVKLEPVPMYAFRDSSVTMYQHNLIIEGQRRLKKGLIAGIKKDVVTTSQLLKKPGKVAIYGWHKPDGVPIQPLYTGHIEKYVDYSHGIRLIHEIIIINHKKYHYQQVFEDPVLQKLICDEEDCHYFRYPTPI